MNIPENLKYTKDHEWILVEGETATVGITDHAQAELTDVVFVELPDAGREVEAGDPVAVVESVKAASDIYAPLSGETAGGNADLEGDPSLVNTDPYGKGWIFRMSVGDPSELDGLLDASAYRELLG